MDRSCFARQYDFFIAMLLLAFWEFFIIGNISQADLTEIYQQLENHKVATCKAETQAANALSSLGKNKAEFQGELNQAHEQIATLEQGLSTSEKLLQDRSQDFQELQTRFASEKERWNAEYNALQTAAAKAETIAQVDLTGEVYRTKPSHNCSN